MVNQFVAEEQEKLAAAAHRSPHEIQRVMTMKTHQKNSNTENKEKSLRSPQEIQTREESQSLTEIDQRLREVNESQEIQTRPESERLQAPEEHASEPETTSSAELELYYGELAPDDDLLALQAAVEQAACTLTHIFNELAALSARVPPLATSLSQHSAFLSAFAAMLRRDLGVHSMSASFSSSSASSASSSAAAAAASSSSASASTFAAASSASSSSFSSLSSMLT